MKRSMNFLAKSPRLLCLLLAMLVFAISVRPQAAQAAAPKASAAGSIAIYLEDAPLPSDVPPYIVPKLNVTMVPLRVISEGLGAVVDWNSSVRAVTIQRSGTLLNLQSGQNVALVNGKSVKLDASVQLVSGRAMVPLRFVGESLGLTVVWEQASKSISLYDTGGTGTGSGSNGSSGAGSGSGTGTGTGTGTGIGSGTGTGSGTGIGNGTGTGTGIGSGTGSGSVSQSLRGAWISTVYNLDWPSAASAGNEAKQKAEFSQLLDDLQGMGMNAVFVQVRAAGDAFYPSALVPWSKYLTGQQGKAPTYDPLAYMVQETHKRGMAFHAWFNPFRAGVDAKTDGLAPNQVMLQHPDWIVLSGGKPYINPGIPEARQHIVDAIAEVVSRYDIDGVHLDDYFYPSSGDFPDSAAFAAYNPLRLSLGDWRRGNVNALISQLDETIHALKPAVRFGVSPFGVWRNKSADPTGSDTKAGVTDYDNMYADVRYWIQQHWVDYVAPQIYWSFDNAAAPFGKLVDWWANEVRGTGVDLYIGHSPYKLGTTEAGWQSANEIIQQLDFDRTNAEVDGDIFFSAKDLRANPLGIADALRLYYAVGNSLIANIPQ